MKNIFILCYIMLEICFNYFVIPNKEFIFVLELYTTNSNPLN